MLNVALIGIGAMGRNHLRILQNLNGVNLVGIHDLNGAEDFGVYRFESLSEIIKLKPDYCVISSPTNTHVEIGSSLIKNGISILLEKPIGLNTSEASTIFDLSQKYNTLIAIGHIERYNAALREAKKRIDAGQLGEIISITTRRKGPYHARIKDSGVVVDLCSHDIDIVHWLTESRYANLFAVGKGVRSLKIEDYLLCVADTENGVFVNHEISWINPTKERSVTVNGTTGSFQIDLLQSDLTYYAIGETIVTNPHRAQLKGNKEGERIQYAFPKPEPLLFEHEQFRDGMLGMEVNLVKPSDALETMKVTDRIIESMKKRVNS